MRKEENAMEKSRTKITKKNGQKEVLRSGEKCGIVGCN